MSYKNRQVEPFVYQRCKNLPGLLAVPVDEVKEFERKGLTIVSECDTLSECKPELKED